MHLQLMLHFQVLSGIALYIAFRAFLVQLRAIVHEKLTDYVSAIESNLDIVSIVE